MQKKVVVIGSNGMLGMSLVNRLYPDEKYKLFALAAGKNRNDRLPSLKYFSIDLQHFSYIKMQLNLINPDYIINALAMTNVDLCETEKELCDQVNVTFVKDLAQVSKEIDAHLIHISTDFIFDGEKGSYYRENDPPNPVNYYGLSKLKSEIEIKKTGALYTILRTILVYGKTPNMKRNNIVLWIKSSLENGEKISIIKDQYRMPTYVGSLVNACLLSMEKNVLGTFHISDKEFLSIYEMALQIAGFFKLPAALIQPISTRQLNQKAKRPPKTGFVLDKAITKLGYKPLLFTEGLTYLLDDLKNNS